MHFRSNNGLLDRLQNGCVYACVTATAMVTESGAMEPEDTGKEKDCVRGSAVYVYRACDEHISISAAAEAHGARFIY